MNTKSNFWCMFLTTLFLTVLLLSNIIAQKLVTVGGYTTTISLIIFPLVYVIGSIFTEVWGAAKARMIILMGLLANVLMAGCFMLVIRMPGAEGRVFHQAAFNRTLSTIPLTVVASMAAYLIGSRINTVIIQALKNAMHEKYMVVRFLLGNFVGTALDSILFVAIGYYALISTNMQELITMILVAFIIKRAYTIVAMIVSVPLSIRLKKTIGAKTY